MSRKQKWELDTGSYYLQATTKDKDSSYLTVWSVDGKVVAKGKAAHDIHVLKPPRDRTELGAVRIQFSILGGARRVTWYPPDKASTWKARLGIGGVDLCPEPGSPASMREERARQHPWLYAARHLGVSVVSIAVPILLVWLAARLMTSFPWPQWNLSWVSSLPAIQALDLSMPEWDPPKWLEWAMIRLELVLPILLVVACTGVYAYRRSRLQQSSVEYH